MKGLFLNSNGIGIANDENLLAARLERLFFSEIGESHGYLEEGSRILDYFYEGDTVDNARSILTEVKILLSVYESNFIPEYMRVDFQIVGNGGSAALIISIEGYFLNNENELYNIELIKVKDWGAAYGFKTTFWNKICWSY